MDINELTYKIRGAIFSVHNELGPGLLESVYEVALMREFEIIGVSAVCQLPIPVLYKGVKLDIGFRVDIMVEEMVIIEIKSVKSLAEVHKKQLLTYLKLAKKPIGILVNFNSASLIDRDSLIRVINSQNFV